MKNEIFGILKTFTKHNKTYKKMLKIQKEYIVLKLIFIY